MHVFFQCDNVNAGVMSSDDRALKMATDLGFSKLCDVFVHIKVVTKRKNESVSLDSHVLLVLAWRGVDPNVQV